MKIKLIAPAKPGFVAFLVLCVSALIMITVADEVGTNDFRISHMGTDGDISFAALHPAVAYNDSTGQYFVVWQADDDVNGENEIFGQFIDAVSGANVGARIQISEMGPMNNPDGDALRPSIAWGRQENEFLVVWHGDHVNNNEFDIYSQRVNADGSLEVGPYRLNVNNTIGDPDFDAFNSAVCYNESENEFFVVWQADDTLDNEYEIYGVRVFATSGFNNGRPVRRVSETGLANNTNYDAINPAVAHNKHTNEYLVVWQADDESAETVEGEQEIFGQFLSNLLAPLGSDDFRISSMGVDRDPNFDACNPAVAFDTLSNRFIIVWNGEDVNPGENEIWARFINGGTRDFAAPQFAVSTTGADGNPLYDAITPNVLASTDQNEFIVAWSADKLFNNDFEIFAQRLSPDGAELGDDDFQLSDMGPDGSELYMAGAPVIGHSADAREYITVWPGDDNITSVNNEFEIFGQRFNIPFPEIAYYPDTIAFGNVLAGEVSGAEEVIVKNTGLAALLVDNLTFSGIDAADFQIDGVLTLPVVIAPGDSETISLVFSPLAAGTKEAIFNILSNDPDNPEVQVQLSGFAIPALPHPFVFLADEDISVNGTSESDGDIHANKNIWWDKGQPAIHRGSLYAREKIQIKRYNTFIGDVRAGDEVSVVGVGVLITGVTENAAAVDSIELDMLSFSSGDSNITVFPGDTLVLDPGSYGWISMKEDARLFLRGGVYSIESLVLKDRCEIEVNIEDGPVDLNISGEFSTRSNCLITVTPEIVAYSRFFKINSLFDGEIVFGEVVDFTGSINAPLAEIKLGRSNNFKGQICSRAIWTDYNTHFEPHAQDSTLQLSLPPAVENFKPESVVSTYQLEQNYPNPFNPTTSIRYTLAAPGNVTLKIYDTLGREVRTLVSEAKPAGSYTIQWDGRNNRNQSVAGGLYIYRIVAGEFTSVRKMIVLK